jgi:hypothetical protein
LEHGLGVVEEASGCFTDNGVVEDGGEFSSQFPSFEEGRPVYIAADFG